MDDDSVIPLPSDFDIGVSTSAFQTEGAAGRRGESIWDRFLSRSDLAEEDWNVAADHLARMEEDLDLVAASNATAYRFSISWPRVFPDGTGRPSSKALDLYDRMLDEALGRGLDAWPCLYHWDLPQTLQEKGGWTNRDTADHLADYAETVAGMLAGRARRIFVMNEPNVHAVLGHLIGMHAPGESDLSAFLAAVHHQNLALGLAVSRLREVTRNTELGTILSLQPIVAAHEGEEHEAAARLADAAFNRAFLDPLFGRGYPEPLDGMLETLVQNGDMAEISQPLDVLGANYYTRLRVAADPDGPSGLALVDAPPGEPVTAMGWQVAPDGLTSVLERLRDDYGDPPVVITECGAAYKDEPGASGRVEDSERASFLLSHLRAALRARDAGCDVRGFLVWTLVDNLEWAEGFSKRFGIVRLERPSMHRVPKLSYDVFTRVATSREVPPLAALKGLV